MTERKPRPPGANTRLVAPAILGIALLLVLLAALWSRPQHRAPPPAAQPPAAVVQPAPPSLLTRDDLIRAAETAASDYADGTPPRPQRSALIGRRFRISIPFGCPDTATGPLAAPATVQFDPATRSLKLSANPIVFTELPLVQTLDNAQAIEAVEGFWLPRPWSRKDSCPPQRQTPAPAIATPPAAPTLGLARIFQQGDARVARRGDRPYEVTRKLDPSNPAALAHAYALILEGRVVGYHNGQAARCWSESADHRPICLYAVVFDRIAFENPTSGEVLGEWQD